MKTRLLTGLLAVCLLNTARAQTADDYKSRIAALRSAIDLKLRDTKGGLYYETVDSAKNPNKHSWLWPLCALIQATNEEEAAEPGKSYMPPVEQAIEQYYSNVPPVPAYQDYVVKERLSSRFYDDNEWVAIAYLDAYNRTHKKKYLEVGEMIYRFIKSGMDTVAGGGIYWKEGDKTTKNTCSNGPGIIVALQLYKITKSQEYLNTALQVYQWTNRHLQAPDGLYYDHIMLPSLRIGRAIYTYNTGTMLQSDVLLYEITKDRKYLTEAERVAKAGEAYFVKNGRLPNNYWFNAVMFRGYIELFKVDKNPQWIKFFADDANGIWSTEHDQVNLVGARDPKSLIDQAAMIEIFARLQELKNSKLY